AVDHSLTQPLKNYKNVKQSVIRTSSTDVIEIWIPMEEKGPPVLGGALHVKS
ncbi:17080_t:CDS:1, partial [Acaulospora colombiana]